MRHAQFFRLVIVLVPALSGIGCAGVLGSYDIAASGLSSGEERLRHLLVAGQPGAAFERVQGDAPDDEMLHALYHGVLAYHAGDYAESARVLDIASYIADERVTTSVSRAALSLVSNDLVLEYEPGRTERLMIPYYAALARLRMGDSEGAAVEARRLSLLLQRYDDEGWEDGASLRATLRYVGGAIFEASGEYADANVAYRNAAAADSLLRLPDDASSRESGSVLVILEQGFVAHRVEEGLSVMLLPEEVEAIAHGSGDDRVAVSAFVAGRVVQHAALQAGYGPGRGRGSSLFVPAPERSIVPRTRRRTVCTTKPAQSVTAADTASPPAVQRTSNTSERECTEKEEEVDGLPYLLKVSWPAYHTAYRTQSARLLGAGEPLPFAQPADISRGVVADFEQARALMVARTIARNTARLALAKGAERRLEEKNEAAGRIVGLIGNIGGVLLERADTRSWHLLPAAVSVVRVELPAGEHELDIEIGSASATRTLSLGPVQVVPGRITVVPVRTWGRRD
ncbi:hypothetical protein BH23GEM9_BH23GEM9_24390 [soil metagenome]